MTTETTINKADLDKALAEAKSTLKTASDKVAANAANDKEWLLENLETVMADKGAMVKAGNAVKAAEAAIADFEVSERFKVMEPAMQTIRDTINALVKAGLPTAPAIGIDLEIVLGDDGAITVNPIVRTGAIDLESLKSKVAEAMAPHRDLMRRTGFRELEGRAVNVGSPSMLVSSGRLFKAAPKAASTRTATASSGGDFKAGQTLTGTHKGVMHMCQVVAKGDGVVFIVNGTEYGSASGAAKAITGVSTNGNKFWKAT